MTKQIKNKSGIIMGYLQDNGSNIQAFNKSYIYQGRYEKSADATFDKSGILVYYGDATPILIYLANK